MGLFDDMIVAKMKPYNHTPPKVKNPDDEPMDFLIIKI